MFSADLYKILGSNIDPDSTVDVGLEKIRSKYDLQAILLVTVKIVEKTILIAGSAVLPKEAFNDKQYLLDVLQDCFKKHPHPHVHNIKDFALSNYVKRICAGLTGTYKIWFVPQRIGSTEFVFIGFPKHDDSHTKVPVSLYEDLSSSLLIRGLYHRAVVAEERLRGMEAYTKEIGHDVASSVQAVLAKARSITRRELESEAIYRRAHEIESEILAIYRHSEALGVTVDRNYQLQEISEVDLYDVVETVCEVYKSEASERGIHIRFHADERSYPTFGDMRALQMALGQILLNAIKYAFSSSSIDIKIVNEGDFYRIEVNNIGVSLPKPPDLYHIWEFGYRSKEAKERHVNGSGIGLYTTRKIVVAHHGSVFASGTGKSVFVGFLVPVAKWWETHAKDELILGFEKKHI